MATNLYNPTFKRPTGRPPYHNRSPSPPRAFVEPLSPSRPFPVEPSFNYPALNGHVKFTANSASILQASQRVRSYSTSYNGGYGRASAAIDTLAEAALAASPSQRSTNSAATLSNGHMHAHPSYQRSHAEGEPPHKRSRSELLLPPNVSTCSSRPTTSYEPYYSSPYHAQPSHGYASRVEEAALLLNFQSSGWTGKTGSTGMLPPAIVRPHANSFPRDVYNVRPMQRLALPQPSTHDLTSYGTQPLDQPAPLRPLTQTASDTPGAPLELFEPVFVGEPPQTKSQPQPPSLHRRVQEHDSYDRGRSDEGAQSHSRIGVPAPASSTGPPKKARGWPKGKPRSSGARKTLAEKAASKRATARKKTPDSKSARRKLDSVVSDVSTVSRPRRRSLSDLDVPLVTSSATLDFGASRRARSVPAQNLMVIKEVTLPKPTRRKDGVTSDTICAGCQTTRETAKFHSELDEWISCNGCKKWFHVDCAGFKKTEVRDVDKFFCTACEPDHGPTTYVRKSSRAHASVDYAELQRGVLKTSEESMEHHYIQPIKDGTFEFDPETFPRIRPELASNDYFEKSGIFVEPICIPAEWNPRPWAQGVVKSMDGQTTTIEPGGEDSTMADLHTTDFEYDTVLDNGQDQLEMVMPQGLTVRNVCNLVGADWPIDVIDVKTQNTGGKWTLSRWADYYEEEGNDNKAIRNVISLEVSHTKLGRLLQRPKVVRDMDLQDDVWPMDEKGKFPKVQFYCLMSVADSYTDFHIDFGGSSVYYHILKGRKTFFFIPPKPKHLKAYQDWNDSPEQNYTFLPHITKECYRVDLYEGDTMLIPSGWIHAVWTPEDSLVVGGNFLNRLSYRNQFRVVDIEKANNTPMKFRYPSFQKLMWYTAIKYMQDDPLPPEVSQMFHDGKRFERSAPVWEDYDGIIADTDARPGSQNARHYSQAEVDGLPDLVEYIFRTVMLVMGRMEDISADKMRRVNASIPKGYGEPLELAKTFALWVAWKRGNEDLPAWAHPDAVLPDDTTEGPPKKLSERKLKILQRQEAIAAWRIAPDRQSARVMTKQANPVPTPPPAPDATSLQPSSSPSAQQESHQETTPYYQHQRHEFSPPPQTAPPPAPMMSVAPNNYVTTPKTSVLGPKRVACDACRKRRIKCKHKDIVQTTAPNGFDGPNGVHYSGFDPAVHDNIVVPPQKPVEGPNLISNGNYGDNTSVYANGSGSFSGEQTVAHVGTHHSQNGDGDYSYLSTMMTGTPELSKRGRSKACLECRKSKRRCVHDDIGNVDPIKAAETPVPRGSVSSQKRASTEKSSPAAVKKIKVQPDTDDSNPTSTFQHLAQMNGRGVLRPYPASKQSKPRAPAKPKEIPPQTHAQQQPPPIDPGLLAAYPSQAQTAIPYEYQQYQFEASEPAQSYSQPRHFYNMPSLEEIANDVLVFHDDDPAGQDLESSGRHFGVKPDQHASEVSNGVHLTNGLPKQDNGVDSAISLGTTASFEQSLRGSAPPEDAPAQPSLQIAAKDQLEIQATQPHPSSTQTKSDTNKLPLYQPPEPPAQSPEMPKRQPSPLVSNGVAGSGKSSSPAAQPKRKRDSENRTSGTKHARVEHNEQDVQSLEMARALHQESLGLRRRSKS